MKKVLVFGASKGGESFLKNAQGAYECLAFVDNDTNKWGKTLTNKKIISPDEISDYIYDEIVLASYWASSIKKQLIQKYNIEETKIYTPPKEMLMDICKPFEDEGTFLFATEVIDLFFQEAIKQNIPLYVNNGTLLGIIRDASILRWDSDIDFAMLYEDSKKLDMEKFITEVLKKINLANTDVKVIKITDAQNRVLAYKIDFAKDTLIPFPISIEFMEIEGDYVIEMVSFGQFKVPKKHILSLERYRYNNYEVNIPNMVDKYLAFIYGDDYKIPKKNITFNDYANYNEVCADTILNANVEQKEIFRIKQGVECE